MEAESLSKASVLELLSHAEGEVELALSLRQELAKSSVKKYTAMESVVCPDDRARGLIQFYGANRTGRFAGRLIQVQNLPQNHLPDLKQARTLVRDGSFDAVELLPDVQDSVITIKIYSRDASLFVSDIMLTEGASLHKWTPAPNEIYTAEVKIDRRGIEVSNADSAQRTVINNTEFSGYYNEEKIFSLNKDETITKKTTVDGELTVGKTKFVPMATASEGLNIVILD